MTASLQTAAPLPRYGLNASSRNAYGLTVVQRGDLQLDPPYQRGSVWTLDQRRLLIRSMMQELPVPAIVLNDRMRPEWEANEHPLDHDANEPFFAVVGGKQRIETLQAWFDGELDVPASWFEADAVASTHATADGDYVTFGELTDIARRKTKNWTIPAVEARADSVAAEAGMYLLVNGAGTLQTDDDLTNARRVAAKK